MARNTNATKTKHNTRQANRKNGSSHHPKFGVGIGVGAAALAAGATAAYLLTGKRGSENRKRLKTWMVEAQREIRDRWKEAKEVNEHQYNAIVESVMRRYRGLREASPEEVAALVVELRGAWKSIAGRVKNGSRSPRNSKGSRPRTKSGRTRNSSRDTGEEQ